MDDLWQVWWQDTEIPKRSSRPFSILLMAHANFGGNNNNNGSNNNNHDSNNNRTSPAKALQVLLAWNDTFAQDWFQAPTREHYDALLKAHAAGAVNCYNDTIVDSNAVDNTDSENTGPAIQTADLAVEVIQLLEQWGGDGMGSQQVMAPGWETYALGIQCLAKVCCNDSNVGNHQSLVTTDARMVHNNSNNVNNNNSNDDSTYQEHLEQLMDRLLEHLESRRHRDGSLQTSHLSDSDLILLLHTWGDAMQCFTSTGVPDNHSKWKAWVDDWNGLVRNSAPLLARLSAVHGAPRDNTNANAAHDYDSYNDNHYYHDQLQHIAFLDASTTAAQTVYNHLLRGTKRAEAMDSTIRNLEAVPWGDSSFSLPLTHHYNLGIQAWANDSTRSGTRRGSSSRVAEESTATAAANAHQCKMNLLERMQNQHGRLIESGTLLEPAQVTRACNSLMIGHLDAGSTEGMMAVWKAMATTQHLRRDSLSYSIVLKALAEQSSRSPDAAMQAYSIWKKMVSVDEARQHVRPHRQHYGWVMVAWSKSRHRQAALYCQEVFDRLLEESRTNPRMKPDVVHYSTLITALGWRNDPAAVKKVLSIFQGMKDAGIEPDLAAYSAVLATMARTQSLEGAQSALVLLNELEELSRDPGARNFGPNLACYTSVIYAWARSGSPEASARCSAVYTRLEDGFERSGRDRALRPNSVVFCALIEAEINRGGVDAGDRACELLDRLERAAADGMAERADSKVYTKVMAAYWKSGDKDEVAKSGAVFERMRDAYQAGNYAAKPDAHSITTLMQAWAKSDAPDKASQTWKLLNGMCDDFRQGNLDMQPTVHTFAAVLNACAYTSSTDPKVKQEAIEIALKAMNELDESFGGPNEVTFRALFQVIGSQVEDMAERTRMASTIFQRCCEEGCVNGWVIKTIRNFVPPLYKKLPVDSKKRLRLPPEWTRNVSPAWESNPSV
jgi:hypothetical protein